MWRLTMRKSPAPLAGRRSPTGLGAGLLWMGADMAHAQAPATTAPVDAAALYGTHCASCHGAQRTGGMGPALLPESLERPAPEALRVIQQGRPATQMPGFADTLSAAEMTALAAWVYHPSPRRPHGATTTSAPRAPRPQARAIFPPGRPGRPTR